MPKVYIEGGSSDYIRMWNRFGYEVTKSLENADVVQFTGGSDVSPELYGEDFHPSTTSLPVRDEYCLNLYNTCFERGIPMTGICRGGQFLNVANGGSMFQHCDGHAIYGTHLATIVDSGKEVAVTSTHHQIMRPNRRDGIVLMVANKLGTYKLHRQLVDGSLNMFVTADRPDDDDIEAVYYEGTKSLCYQPHPEWCKEDSECLLTYKYFLRNYLDLPVK